MNATALNTVTCAGCHTPIDAADSFFTSVGEVCMDCHARVEAAEMAMRARAEAEPKSLEGNLINGGSIVGLLTMLAAAVWFIGGLSVGVVFFYPPILFLIGLFGFLKGLVAR